MRPIDADRLKEYKCSICNNRERCEDRETVCSDIAEIDEQPTIEAEPVKHGRWNYRHEEDWCYCTACGMDAEGSGEECLETDYCPHCGARMDGD